MHEVQYLLSAKEQAAERAKEVAAKKNKTNKADAKFLAPDTNWSLCGEIYYRATESNSNVKCTKGKYKL